MKAYLERAKMHDEFMKVQTHEFEIGKRHLANMMGEPVELYDSQRKIDVSMSYYFFFQESFKKISILCVFRRPSLICFLRLYMTTEHVQ